MYFSIVQNEKLQYIKDLIIEICIMKDCFMNSFKGVRIIKYDLIQILYTVNPEKWEGFFGNPNSEVFHS